MRNDIPKKVMSKLKNKKALDKLQNLSLDEGRDLLQRTPDFVAMRLYAKNCSKEELFQLRDEWLEKCPERFEKLKKALKRERRVVIGL